MKIRFTKRLFFRQTRNAILAAFILGLVVSLIQIIFDFTSEQKRIDETVLQVLNTTKESASQAAYNLNSELASRVVKGLFEYQAIYSAEIKDDFGRELAALERPLISHYLTWLGPFIEADQNIYKINLYVNEGQTIVGEMRVRVDRFLIAEDFIDRAWLVILAGIFRNFVLAIVFGILFYMTLARPVMNTIVAVSRVDAARPGHTPISIPAGHVEDELGLLINNFNGILSGLEETLYKRGVAEEELKRKQMIISQLNLCLEERVRERTSELETANKEMEAFTYSVSHDLRAPLRTIGGFSNILKEEYADIFDEQASHYLNRVQMGTQKMEALISDLLKLSRTIRGDMHRSKFNISELMLEVLGEYQEREPERRVDIQISPDLITHADRRFVRVVLENLVSNAWKYTDKCETPQIIFGEFLKDGKKVFYIRDNGAGFDMAYADKLFTPFQRLHSAKQFEGTGVGLATVQRVIRRHGGEIWAEAKVNEGATFLFTLEHSLSDLAQN